MLLNQNIMKEKLRKTIMLGVMMIITINCISQVTENSQQQKKEIIVDFYTAGPNVTLFLFKLASTVVASDVKLDIKGTPMVGARFGYTYEENITFGADFNYRSSSVGFTHVEAETMALYNYNIKYAEYRASLRAEYHMKQGNEKLDLYFPASLGIRYINTKYKTNHPLGDFPFEVESFGLFSTRIGVGLRYYPVHNLGINTEIGIGGGSIFQFGLSVRI